MRRLHRSFPASIALVIALLGLPGCVVPDRESAASAIRDVNERFRVEYEAILAQVGTRVVQARQEDALVAMRAALAGMGMQLESQNPRLGVFTVVGDAPRPLDSDEWDRVSRIDEPLLREIAQKHVGTIPTWFLHFDPKGLKIVISVTLLEVPEGTSVTLTARLREVEHVDSMFPRREYLSPTVVRTGIEKIWTALDRELAAARRAS